MKTETRSTGAVRLTPCHYGLSKVPFRGPMRPTEGRFVACLGGSETFAKFVRAPYPDLLEQGIGDPCINLGCQSAGPDVFLRDTAVQSICHDAAATVIEVMGAVNLSNRFYKVHPRRNDRFIAPSDKLIALFPEVDFAEISFTGHLVTRLRKTDEARWALVLQHLQQVWVRRMKALIGQAAGPVVLLWLTQMEPPSAVLSDLGHPDTVTPQMVQALRAARVGAVRVAASPGRIEGLEVAGLDRLCAARMLGAEGHRQIARALEAPLRQMMT